MTRLETVHKKYTELLADMKKLDRDYAKSKKRADQLQKDQDKGKSELNKTATMKDKLEKLCRELTKENKKVKVGLPNTALSMSHPDFVISDRRTMVTGREQETRRHRKESPRNCQ
jgi:chromosome segregation ATPase